MIVVNNGTTPITLVVNGSIVSLKRTQACVISEKEYCALKRLFPALTPVEQEAPVEVVEEPEVKPVRKRKKQK